MRVHIDALGWLHVIWGAFGVLTGASLEVLAWGTHASLPETTRAYPAVWFLAGFGLLLLIVGVAMGAAGWSVLRRRPFGRVAALVLAVINLLVVPFGTALAVYTFWTLFNDEARREFAPADTIRG
jgi:hypothetical protein